MKFSSIVLVLLPFAQTVGAAVLNKSEDQLENKAIRGPASKSDTLFPTETQKRALLSAFDDEDRNLFTSSLNEFKAEHPDVMQKGLHELTDEDRELFFGLWEKLNRIFHHGYEYYYDYEPSKKGKGGGSKGSRRDRKLSPVDDLGLTEQDRELFFGLMEKIKRIFGHGYDYYYDYEPSKKGKGGGSKGSRRERQLSTEEKRQLLTEEKDLSFLGDDRELFFGLWEKLNRIFHHGYDYDYDYEPSKKGKGGGSKGSRRERQLSADVEMNDEDRELFFGLWEKLNRIFHHDYDYYYDYEPSKKGKGGGSKGSRRERQLSAVDHMEMTDEDRELFVFSILHWSFFWRGQFSGQHFWEEQGEENRRRKKNNQRHYGGGRELTTTDGNVNVNFSDEDRDLFVFSIFHWSFFWRGQFSGQHFWDEQWQEDQRRKRNRQQHYGGGSRRQLN